MAKINLPSLSKVKKTLYADWALRVKQRDGWKCLLCDTRENLTAHHWYVSDHHAHAARYCVDNGATLCYACHIRSVHTRADYVTVKHLFDTLSEGIGALAYVTIDRLIETELTTAVLRNLWTAMQQRVIPIDEYDISDWYKRGGKQFACVALPHPIAVVGNVIRPRGLSAYEVTVVSPFGDNGFRYTLKEVGE